MAKRLLALGFLALIAPAPPVHAQIYKDPATEAQSMGTVEVSVRDTISNVIGLVWLKKRSVDQASIPVSLSRRLDGKVAQRNNFEGYKFRSDSVRQTTIGGQLALSAVADYVSAGQQMVEYITWIDGEKSRVLFLARTPASGLFDLQSRFDTLIQSAMVP
jgi:hypothetical protein